MAEDVVPGIQLLWCSIIGCVRVGEMARFEVSDRHFDLERGMLLDCVQILGLEEL
jgi:hypothetical protein